MNMAFEKNRIRRAIERAKTVYEFILYKQGKFKEPELVGAVSLPALYHVETGYISVTTGDATQGKSKPLSKLLCLFDDFKTSGIKENDTVLINGKKYKVNGWTNVMETDFAIDMSLERFDG